MVRGKEVHRAEAWGWQERQVDPAGEHFKLCYGSANDSDWDNWLLIARVGLPSERVFGVEFLVKRGTKKLDEMIDAVAKELDFYGRGGGGDTAGRR